MHSRIVPGAVAAILVLFLFETGCTKFDSTTLGTDLIPAVDNINTFSDTFNVITTQGYFNDSITVGREAYNALGHINADPLFGKTTANIFVQLKPTFYPFLLSPGDTLLGLDSVVLALSYKGTWGDTSVTQHLEVRKVEDLGFRDSATKLRPVTYAPNVTTLLGSTNVFIPSLKNKLFFAHGKDSSTNQIRIKLTDAAYNNLLFTSDTSLISTGTNAYRNDSLFRKAFNGLAIFGDNLQGNGLMYISLAESKTRLEIHFRKKSRGFTDTVYTSLFLAGNSSPLFPSATANNIIRDRSGTPSATPSSDANYIQTSPGTFVSVSVPGLNSFRDTNRIIHRALLIVDQVPDNPLIDDLFTPPAFLYVDLKDEAAGPDKYKPVYKDLNPSAFYNPDDPLYFYPNTVDNNYFGGKLTYKYDIAIGKYASYGLNLTRYIQRMVNTKGINYPLRLYAPYSVQYPQYSPLRIDYLNQIAYGRVKVGSGTNPAFKMKVVVIWSKVQH